MFNDNDRIAAVRQSAQNLDQLMDIGKMQSRRRLIQNVDRLSGSSLAQLRRQLDTLCSGRADG